MNKLSKTLTAFLMLFPLVCTTMYADFTSATPPMIKKQVSGLSYGSEGQRLYGLIPALNDTVSRPWQLDKWTGKFHFEDGSTVQVGNYDVFNVKKDPNDPKFDRENGFGLVHRSKEGLGDLFDAITSDLKVSSTQKSFYKEAFTSSYSDFDSSHPYAYTLENNIDLLRTSGVVQRMGIQFDRNESIDNSDRTAHFNVSPWPQLKVTQGKAISVNFSAYGYTERNIRLVATKKGAFPDLSKVVSLTDGKLIRTSDPIYNDSLTINAKNLVKVLGKEVDIVIDDGYGRTAIQSLTLPEEEQNMDYIPTSLTLTEGGQLWVQFKYEGEDIVSSDYINQRGMPMTAAVKVTGPVSAEFSLPSMYKNFPTTIKNGQEFRYMLGKIQVDKSPGKYTINVTTTINNPNHQDRALELPSEVYKNNEIKDTWVIENKDLSVDLIAQSITAAPSSIQVGGSSAITAKVKNNGALTQSAVMIRFFDNQNVIYEVRKTLPANQVTTVGPFTWTGTSPGVHNISVHVDPDKEKPDKDRTNNIATTGCRVNAPSGGSGGNGGNGGGPGSGDCQEKAVGNWTVTYPLITGYHTKTREVSWTDANGKSHSSTETYTDYSDPIWETRDVTYQENLSIVSKVDTKQGISTNLNNPKESDRESRGSWEIIPYAGKTGTDPNTITRAGYGFEIKVDTKYTTDWETKVPKGLENTAKPIGGTYHGPETVSAAIYDTKGRLVKTVALEKTGGGKDSATWELPEVTVKSDSGKTYKDRKFYTSVDSPDGNYTVRITTGPAGARGISVCSVKTIEIFGSMYDDVQNLRDVR
ncbi:CARDB domain-containing protein [Paenibacillus solani]|uniref:CARDB domain-containing protein n=1 Tax=Paenibacillus solani TaxID=1705565 RepID=UPI003D2AD9E9